MKDTWVYGDKYLFRLSDLMTVQYDRLLTDGLIDVTFIDWQTGGRLSDTISGYGGEELIQMLRPTALEGKRYEWRKHAWAIHNIIGHPVMQLLAWMRLYKAAMWVHDVTAPRTINVTR